MGRAGFGRRMARWLPGRVTLAWAVLGAAAGVTIMCAPWVYEGRSWSRLPYWTPDGPVLSRSGIDFSGGRVRVLGQVVYEAEYQESGEAQKEVGRWHRRVAGWLAGLGALAGVLVGWRERRRTAGRPAARGGLVGLAAAVAVFAVLVWAGVPGRDDGPTFGTWVRWEVRDAVEVGWRYTLNEYLVWEGAGLCIVAAAVGWATQVAAAARGLRFPPGRPADQAEDYAEATAAEPVGAPDRGGMK
jgi:hypothetical protein